MQAEHSNDCALYVVHHVSAFMSAPDVFLAHVQVSTKRRTCMTAFCDTQVPQDGTNDAMTDNERDNWWRADLARGLRMQLRSVVGLLADRKHHPEHYLPPSAPM